MSKRSLTASPSGRAKAKQAFQRTGWTQEYLAYQAGLETRQPVWKFFSGRPVERHVFIEICFQLQLNWEEVVELPPVEPEVAPVLPTPPEAVPVSIPPDETFAALKAKMRGWIERRCSYLQESLEAVQSLP
ncbi:MAG TPA: hypothetical protein V6D19_22700, partial [Stenomitos sp.]